MLNHYLSSLFSYFFFRILNSPTCLIVYKNTSKIANKHKHSLRVNNEFNQSFHLDLNKQIINVSISTFLCIKYSKRLINSIKHPLCQLILLLNQLSKYSSQTHHPPLFSCYPTPRSMLKLFNQT